MSITDYHFLTDTCSVDPFSTFGTFGAITYSTASRTTHYCRVEYRQHQVRTPDGRTEVASMTVYVGGQTTGGSPPTLTIRDRLVLSTQAVPNSTSAIPLILAVDRTPDQAGILHHVAVHCG